MSRLARLRVALGINIAIIAVQLVFGIVSHSIGLLADAAHNASDVGALLLSMFAIGLARRAPAGRHSFGYHRATILAAQANAASILVVTGILAVEAARRISHPGDVRGPLVAAIAAIALAGNAVAALVLRDNSGDLNMRAAVMHMVADALSSAGVLAAGLVITVRSGWDRLDPIVSLVIAALIIWRATKLLRHISAVLLEASPIDLDVSAVVRDLNAVDGVESVHDLHTWSLSSSLSALSAHLVLEGHPTLEEAQVVGARAKQLLATRFEIGHATLELECETCADDPADACTIPELTEHDSHNHAGHNHAAHNHAQVH